MVPPCIEEKMIKILLIMKTPSSPSYWKEVHHYSHTTTNMLKLKPIIINAITHITKKNVIFETELSIKFLVGPITTTKFPNSASKLSLKYRILHLIVTHKTSDNLGLSMQL